MGTVEKEVEYGLQNFANERTVEIPLRDALYAFKAIGEFIAFFHQPDGRRTLAEVERFIGNRFDGALHVLWEAYYNRLQDVWPDDVKKAFDDGVLDWNPLINGETG
jgi:hypothetical protein